MNLEDEIASTLAEEISKEIDKELLDTIMFDLLIKEGWTETRVIPSTGVSPKLFDWYTDTAEWIHLNATGDYKLLKGQWLFEKSEDATLFILRWS